MQRRQILTTGAAALALGSLPRRPALAADKVSFRLNWYLGGSHAAFVLGRDRGYYKDEGIDIEIQEGRGSARSVQLVSAGSDDLAMADAGSLMTGVTKGLDALAVMSLINVSTFCVAALAKSGIKTINDVEGRSLAVTAGDALTQLWPAVVAANKLDASKIKLVMMDAAAKPVAVMEGRVDALLGGISDQPNLMRAKGFEVLVIPFAEVGVNTIGMTIVGRPDKVKANPDLVRRFVKATGQSVQAALDDPDAAAAAVQKMKPDLDLETLKKQVLGTNASTKEGLVAGKPIGWGPPEVWAQTLDLMKTYQGLKTEKPATTFYTNELVT